MNLQEGISGPMAPGSAQGGSAKGGVPLTGYAKHVQAWCNIHLQLRLCQSVVVSAFSHVPSEQLCKHKLFIDPLVSQMCSKEPEV